MALSPAPISLARTPKVAAWPRFGAGFGSGFRSGFATRLGTSFTLLLATLVPAGCESSLHSVDQATNEKLRASAEQLKGGAIYPQLEPNTYEPGSYFPEYPKDVAAPATDNPAASDLKFESVKREKEDAASITKRFEAMEKRADNTRVLTFDDAVAYALEHSEEYLNAEEAYLLVAIRLLIEEHRWEPIPSNITTAGYTSNGGGSRFDNALSIVNELGASQKLPFGGDVSAAFVARATQQLDDYLNSTDTQGASFVLRANIPLLSGFGDVAQEDLVQSRRNLVYAARSFEQFRRNFYFDLSNDYLNLVLQLQGIANGRRQVERSADVEARTKALVTSGRTEPFQADLATQNTLFALDRLSGQREAYRLSVDRFKARIGMDVAEPVEIDPTQFKLPVPKVNMQESLGLAFRYRLDLQNERDLVDDFARKVDVARNATLGDLNLRLTNNLPTDSTLPESGLNFDPNSNQFAAAIVYEMPLDRVDENLRLRQSQILLEQSKRSYYQSRDDAAVGVRQAARGIERSLFSNAVAEKNVQASMNRQAAIDAAPDRATARDRTDAVDALRRAQDSLDSAKKDLQIAILRYLNNTGQLRISPQGKLIPLPGMEFEEDTGPGIVDTSP